MRIKASEYHELALWKMHACSPMLTLVQKSPFGPRKSFDHMGDFVDEDMASRRWSMVQSLRTCVAHSAKHDVTSCL